jgi:hypothetical protein
VQLLRKPVSVKMLHVTKWWTVMFVLLVLLSLIIMARSVDSYTGQQILVKPSVWESFSQEGGSCDHICLTHRHLLFGEPAPIFAGCRVPLVVSRILIGCPHYDGDCHVVHTQM